MPDKMSNDGIHNRMQILLGRYMDGTITDSEADQLFEFLREHPHWDKKIREQLSADNFLMNDDVFACSDEDLEGDLTDAELPKITNTYPLSSSRWISRYREKTTNKRIPSKWIVLPLVLILAMTGLFAWNVFHRLENKNATEFASVTRTSNCLWSDSSTTTRPGTRLGSCILHLERGIALIRFDCDVEVSLEGPSRFEIKDRKRIFLHSGRLVASALSDQGKGFVVDTPDSTIKDLGTRFGVFVPKEQPSEVFVMEGSVEVLSHSIEKPLMLKKGDCMTMGEWNGDLDASFFAGEQITTAMGRGKEAWVICRTETLAAAARNFPQAVSKVYMHVKTDQRDIVYADRKAIFTIDLENIDRERRKTCDGVTLMLSYGPTEIGYASNTPDSTFAVYGLIDEKQDTWDEKSISWENFPGNAQRNVLNSDSWTFLGRFKIKPVSRSGHIRIAGDSLREFLEGDTNGLATFAIVCETFATDQYSMVFGFANRYHTELQPPRLCFQAIE